MFYSLYPQNGTNTADIGPTLQYYELDKFYHSRLKTASSAKKSKASGMKQCIGELV